MARSLEHACTSTKKHRGKHAALGETIARAARDGGITHHQMGYFVNLFLKNFVDVLCEAKIIAIPGIGTYYAAPRKATGKGKGRLFSKVFFVPGATLKNEVDNRVAPSAAVGAALSKHRRSLPGVRSPWSSASRFLEQRRLRIIRSASGDFQSVFVQPTGKVS